MTARDVTPRLAVGERARSRLLSALAWIPLVLLIIWTLGPFFVSISTSLKEKGEVFADVSLIPRNPQFSAYTGVFGRQTFRSAFLNSVLVGFGTTALTLILSVPSAYALARWRFRLRHFLLLFMLIPRLVPDLALMVPLYRLAVSSGMLDKRVTLMGVYTGMLLPLSIWLLVGFFQQVPRELEEAATVDGASLVQRLRSVVLPLAFPALITIGVLAFREAWNEFALALVLTTTPGKRTLPYELFLMQGRASIPDFPSEAAFALMTIAPFIVVYMFLERYVVSGLTSGAIK